MLTDLQRFEDHTKLEKVLAMFYEALRMFRMLVP